MSQWNGPWGTWLPSHAHYIDIVLAGLLKWLFFIYIKMHLFCKLVQGSGFRVQGSPPFHWGNNQRDFSLWSGSGQKSLCPHLDRIMSNAMLAVLGWILIQTFCCHFLGEKIPIFYWDSKIFRSRTQFLAEWQAWQQPDFLLLPYIQLIM